MSPGDKTKPGTYYGRTADGRLIEIAPHLVGPAECDVWICRRVIDYPHGAPKLAAIDLCSRCGAAIAYNPARAVTAPRVCMQCMGIQPIPFDE